MKKPLAAIRALFNALAFILGADCEARRKAVDDGICDFGGQGRNKYGK